MPMSDIVNVSITTDTVQAAGAGFGKPLILGAHVFPNNELVRSYASAAEVAADGFATTTPEYLAASKLFAQNPKVEEIAIGRRTSAPTLRWDVTPVVANSSVYSLEVNGTTVSYTSDASATAAEIIAGLKTAIDALALPLTTTDMTTFLRIAENVAGAWHQLRSPNIARLGVKQSTVSVAATIQAELDAIRAVDSSWYVVLSVFNSSGEVDAISDWAETNSLLYIATTQDSDAATTGDGGTDVASVIDDSGNARTAVAYSSDNSNFFGEAWAGRVLPLDPGAASWKFKTLAGVEADVFTTTQLNNLRAKNANFYYSVGSTDISAEGMLAAGDFIDVVHGRDWLETRMEERIFARLANLDKVPMTDAGIAIIEAEVRAQLLEAVGVGFLASDPAPEVSVPKASSISNADKAARLLRNVRFTATVAGSIHKVTISGNVSL